MSIVDNKVLDPVARCQCSTRISNQQRNVSWEAYPMQPASWVDVYLSEHFPWVQP